jgi:hypothetical protein
VWPCRLFFCDLEQDDLKVMTLRCLPSVAALKVDGQTNADGRQLDAFLYVDLPYFDEMSQRAELWPRAAARRVDAILAYFELRFWPTSDGNRR